MTGKRKTDRGKKRTGGVMKVVAVRPDGQPAGFFDAIIDATRLFGISYKGIRNCIHGKRKTCHGLMWYPEPLFRELFISHPERLKFQPDPNRSIRGAYKKGSKANLGNRWSEEQRRRKSEQTREGYRKGLYNRSVCNCAGRNRIAVVEMETERVWPSYAACAQTLGVTSGAVYYAIHHGNKIRKTGHHYWPLSEYNKIFKKELTI